MDKYRLYAAGVFLVGVALIIVAFATGVAVTYPQVTAATTALWGLLQALLPSILATAKKEDPK